MEEEGCDVVTTSTLTWLSSIMMQKISSLSY